MSVITDVAFVALLTSVPPHHRAISRTADSSDDADLYPDRFLSRKTRYLCYSDTRAETCDPKTPILVNMSLINDGERVPDGFRPIMNTVDTGERACRKKILCAKFSPFSDAIRAVTDLIVCSRARHAPPGFELLGEVNSLSIMYKTAPMAEIISRPSSGLSRSSPNNSGEHRPPRRPSPPKDQSEIYAFATKRRGTVHPLSGIPFEISRKYAADDFFEANAPAYSIPVKTMTDIENEYQYRFSVERSLLHA
ncbi:unnamed protein product [Calicophoron daubneyi]|uniref:Multivesicular body subunit 12B n=1 Tax=Calicophoron daubneyi TaxID=300641 RepID=A0AAV2TSR6_CALDB